MTSLSPFVLAVASSPIASVLVKTAVVAIVGLAAAALLRRGRASVRHLVLACTFAAMLLIPVGTALLPSLTFEVAMPEPSVQQVAAPAASASPVQTRPAASSTTEAPQPPVSLALGTVLAALWIGGATLFAAVLASGLWKLRRMRRTALPWLEERDFVDTLARQAGIMRTVDLLIHEDAAAPITCGLISPVIIFPTDARDWDQPALRRVIVHELEHVRRHDWWVHLSARAVCAAYWFNPLAWIAYRQLALDAERACDDAVIREEESTQYAEQLVHLARRLAAQSSHPALAMAARSDLSKRVRALLDQHQVRGRAGIARIAAITAVAAALLLAVAPVHVIGAAGPAPADEQRNRSRADVNTIISEALGERLIEIAERGRTDDLRALIEQGGLDINISVGGDGSPLIAAARAGNLANVRFLLDRGADPNMGVEGDGNPLIMASREGHLPIVQLLIDRGANVNAAVAGDENALIQASGEGRLDVVKLLVSRGADVNARIYAERAFGSRNEGEWRTPLNQAEKGRHRAVADFLRSVGATQ